MYFVPPQERLSYIGPEEFVQAFVQKDPLDNDKVTPARSQGEKHMQYLRNRSLAVIPAAKPPRPDVASFLLQTDVEFTQQSGGAPPPRGSEGGQVITRL